MPYISARYQAPGPLETPGASKQVEATDDQGTKWYLTEDSQVGAWQEYVASGGVIDPYEAPPPTSSDVNIERDRRITGGFTFEGNFYQSRELDQRNIADAANAADVALANGADRDTFVWQEGSTQDFAWIAADNTRVPMTAPTTQRFGQEMYRFKQQCIFAARQLKDAAPNIPFDFADDKYWGADWGVG